MFPLIILVCLSVQRLTLATESNSSTGENRASEPQRIFRAYDCSEPKNKEPLRLPNRYECNEQAPVPDKQTNVHYAVLHRLEHLRVNYFACEVHISTFVEYCGAYDHQTAVFPFWRLHQPIEISEEECRRMWQSRNYLRSGRPVGQSPIQEGLTHFRVQLVGSTGIDSNHMTCEGGIYRINGRDYHNLVVWEQHEVKLTTGELMIRGTTGEAIVYTSQQILDCPGKAEACVNKGFTAYWKYPVGQDACMWAIARRTRGLEVSVGKQRVYMSNDGSMIRLVKKESLSVCGTVVHATNYDKLLLVTIERSADFKKTLHPHEMSIITYSNMKDAFLYGVLTQQITKEFQRILHEDCLQRKAVRSTALAQLAAETRAATEGETTALGDGWFATSAGEVWYRYACQTIMVVALESDYCYNALPVKLSTTHWEKYRKYHPQLTELLHSCLR